MITTLGGRVPERLRPPGYPDHLELDLDTPRGMLHVRPIVPADGPRLSYELASADEETLYLRFFVRRPRFTARDIEHLVTLDYRTRLALVAWHDDTPVAVARYEATDEEGVAEVAFVVRPDFRRLGLARQLVEILGKEAAANGYDRFVALFLPENEAAAKTLSAAGFGPPRLASGVMEAEQRLQR